MPYTSPYQFMWWFKRPTSDKAANLAQMYTALAQLIGDTVQPSEERDIALQQLWMSRQMAVMTHDRPEGPQ